MNRASKETDLFELRGALLCRPHGAPIPRRGIRICSHPCILCILYTYIHTFTYIHTYIHLHTYIHIYIYIYQYHTIYTNLDILEYSSPRIILVCVTRLMWYLYMSLYDLSNTNTYYIVYNIHEYQGW